MALCLAFGGMLLSACASTVGGAGVAAPGEVAVYRSEVSASAAAAVRAEGVELCSESMSSMVVMVRGVNTFIDRLNRTHSYPAVGDLDDKARASLIAGADQIRPNITDTSPADVVAPAKTFLDSTARLEDAIRRELRTALNPVSGQWSRDKQRLLDACGAYTPIPAPSSATPRAPETDAAPTVPSGPSG